MSDNTLAEYFVKLGWNVDNAGADHVAKVLRGVTIQAQLAADVIEKVVGKLKEFSEGIASAYEDLYYASQRNRASVENIKAFQYAAANMGSSVESARDSIESFGRTLRGNSGFYNVIATMGVRVKNTNGSFRDTVDIMIDLGKVMAKMPEQIRLQQADMFGFDEQTMRAIISPEFAEAMAKYRKLIEAGHFDPQGAAEAWKDFNNTFRDFMTTLDLLVDKVVTRLVKEFGPLFRQFVDYLINNSDTITTSILKVIDTVIDFAKRTVDEIGGSSGFIKAWTEVRAEVGKVLDVINAVINGITKFIGFFNNLDSQLNKFYDQYMPDFMKRMEPGGGGAAGTGTPDSGASGGGGVGGGPGAGFETPPAPPGDAAAPRPPAPAGASPPATAPPPAVLPAAPPPAEAPPPAAPPPAAPPPAVLPAAVLPAAVLPAAPPPALHRSPFGDLIDKITPAPKVPATAAEAAAGAEPDAAPKPGAGARWAGRAIPDATPVNYSQPVAAGVNIEGLKAEFRDNLEQFQRDAAAAGIKSRVISAYRSIELQRQLWENHLAGLAGRPFPYPNQGGKYGPVGRPGHSFHNVGEAADVIATNGNQQALIDFARAHPEYGIAPLPGDAPHFQQNKYPRGQMPGASGGGADTTTERPSDANRGARPNENRAAEPDQGPTMARGFIGAFPPTLRLPDHNSPTLAHAPLTSPAPPASQNNVTLNQKTTISVDGSYDAHELTRATSLSQLRTNGDLLRTMQGSAQ